MPSSAVDNPARSAAHFARVDERRRDLRQQLNELVANRSFVWELGCGHGHFLTAYAEAHPEKLCVGIDLVSERIGRAQRKRDRAKLNNLFFIHAEARLFLESLPPDAAFSAIFVLFPDPWPKVRHHKHRILQTAFLSAAAKHAAKECRLYFRTDYAPYFADAQQTFAEHANWQIAEEPWPFEFETVFQSRAEKHYSLVARLRS